MISAVFYVWSLIAPTLFYKIPDFYSWYVLLDHVIQFVVVYHLFQPLCVKFEVCSFSRSRDEAVPKFKSKSRDLRPLIVYFYVILSFLGILVTFRGDSLISCQDIRENALHWFMLEVLPKKLFFGV